MRMVELTMVTGRNYPEVGTGEDDGLQHIEPVETTGPVALDPTQVRNFYPRKHGRPGTRILFRNGSALAVTEDYAAVKAAIEGSDTR